MRNKYFWQGDPVKVEFGCCKVEANIEKPLYWYNYECLGINREGWGLVAAIKVTAENQSFCIANHFGIGAHKLKNGGWPNYSHFSLPLESFEVPPWHMGFQIREFDLEGYEMYESERKQWQKEKYPEEYERMEQFKKSFKLVK